MAAAERFFTHMVQEVLDATERITNHMETNLNFLFFGSNNMNSSSSSTNNNGDAHSSTESLNNNDDMDDSMIMMEEDMNPLQGMAEQVMNGIMDGQARPQTLLEHIHAFQSAITWTDPFIIGILLFQCMMFLCTIYVSRYNTNFVLRITIMIFMAIIVRVSEYINQYGAQHWNEWSMTTNVSTTKLMTQNYFDPQGYFMTIMICGPLLLYSFIMLCCYLHEASTLLIQVKKMQMQKKQQQQQVATSKPTTESLGIKKDQ